MHTVDVAGVNNSSVEDVRVISIYATSWRYRGPAPKIPLEEKLPLGVRLEEFHYLFREQLPLLLYDRTLEVEDLGLSDPLADTKSKAPRSRTWTVNDLKISQVKIWLFYLPSDQVVAALDVKFSSPPIDSDAESTIRVLENCAFAEFTINEDREKPGESLGQHIARISEERGCEVIKEDVGLPLEEYRVKLPPERHQIIFAPSYKGRQPLNQVQATPILYRAEPPFRPEFLEIREPLGLNPTDETKRGLVTPYTSLLVGHHEYIKNSVFLTAVQAVGTSARFRQIWHKAHGRVREFRIILQEQLGVQRRADMEKLADELGNLELELSFSVETSSDLGLLIPTLRSVSFHRELYAAMELQERADRVSRMFTRLESSIRSELTAIDIRDNKKNDRRRLRWNFALNLLGVVVVPISLLLAFFGVSTKDVEGESSMYDIHRYQWEYLSVGAVALLIPLLAWVAAALFSAWQDYQDRKRMELTKKRIFENSAAGPRNRLPLHPVRETTPPSPRSPEGRELVPQDSGRHTGGKPFEG